MEFALNFARSNLGIDSPALLSSPFLLVVLAYFEHRRDYRLGSDEARQLRYWALAANAMGRFSHGSSESILDQDLATIRNGGGVHELIDRLRLQFGRLDITAEEPEGRNQRTVQDHVPGLPRSGRQGLAQPPDHCPGPFGQSTPPAVPSHIPQGAAQKPLPPREADDIANLAFIGGKTNRAISDKAPALYLLPLVAQHGVEPFAAALNAFINAAS